jgi:methyl-accepting chemotaxis protein
MNAETIKTTQTFESKTISRLWITLLIIIVLLVSAIWILKTTFEGFSRISLVHVNYINNSNRLMSASDYLTNQVRLYVMTGDTTHLQNYWHEVEQTKTREEVLTELQRLESYEQLPKSESLLPVLERAKNESDILVKTEKHAMKLILDVTGVPALQSPIALQSFVLPPEDTNKTAGEKIELARNLVFNQAYTDSKTRIVQPIIEFQKNTETRITAKSQLATQQSNLWINITLLLASINIICLLTIVWCRLLPIQAASVNDK